MKERPILFRPELVRAILDGRKTVTRRVVKPIHQDRLGLHIVGISMRLAPEVKGPVNPRIPPGVCPYGGPGDRLWVRETWQAWKQVNVEYDEWEPLTREAREGMTWEDWLEEHCEPDAIEYLADGESIGPWTPSIHMPRWASRLSLEVTDVGVERLQRITWHDIRAEGLGCPTHDFHSGRCIGECPDLRRTFAEGWTAINGKRGFGWDANPWVWVVRFKVAEAARRAA